MASLFIHNQIADISRMCEWLCDEIDKMGLTDELQFKFDLCANEAVTNIISYAYCDDQPHEIALNLSLQDNLIKLEITDDGAMFNPLEKPTFKNPTTLEDADIGGLGINLIHHYMDVIRYDRINNKNVFSMGIFIHGGFKSEVQHPKCL